MPPFILAPVFNSISSRLSYAFIGFIFGAILGALFWYLYDLGMSPRYRHYLLHFPEIHANLKDWVKWVGGICALTGFVLKDQVGNLIGFALGESWEIESKRSGQRHSRRDW